MKTMRFTFFALVTVIFLSAGCSTPKPEPNPLAGWRIADHEPNQSIEKNYQDYIRNLPTNVRTSHGPIFFFEDGTGLSAIKFETGDRGTSWSHVLIYDKEGKRIKTLKYVSGHYRS